MCAGPGTGRYFTLHGRHGRGRDRRGSRRTRLRTGVGAVRSTRARPGAVRTGRRTGRHGRDRRVPVRPRLPVARTPATPTYAPPWTSPRSTRRPVEPGMVLAHPDGYRILHGSQAALIATIRSGLGQPQDIARLLRWTEPLRKPPERMLAGADMTLGESLDRHGISGRIREEVLRPFFRLVFADEDLQHVLPVRDARRCRRCGWACPPLPALGMQALPNQLALGLDHPGRARHRRARGVPQHRRGRPHPHRQRQDHRPRGGGRHRPDDGLDPARPRHPDDARTVDAGGSPPRCRRPR